MYRLYHFHYTHTQYINSREEASDHTPNPSTNPSTNSHTDSSLHNSSICVICSKECTDECCAVGCPNKIHRICAGFTARDQFTLFCDTHKHLRPDNSSNNSNNSNADSNTLSLQNTIARLDPADTNPYCDTTDQSQSNTENITTMNCKKCGLDNPHNCCYINSILQALYCIPPIRETYIKHGSSFSSQTLSFKLSQLFQNMNTTANTSRRSRGRR